ncbi:MAG: HEAT repeat domain-containing protein [Bryobacterales bacterium]
MAGLTVARQDDPELSDAMRAQVVQALVNGLGDDFKGVREAAFWGLRQHLLDDVGWPELLAAYDSGDARTRQSVVQALVTRADLSGPRASIAPEELAKLLARAMEDPHPGVRAYAFKAAWRWWVWNPGVRDILNEAWASHLTRPETNVMAETALRYSTASMLMVNGQIANQTGGDNLDQQYPELSELCVCRCRRAASDDSAALLDRRLAAVAATHFQERGNDGGPGQMGYSTPGASQTLGDAVLAAYRRADDPEWRKIALEGAANINHAELQRTLLELLQTGDLDLVATAARALANPQALTARAAGDAAQTARQGASSPRPSAPTTPRRSPASCRK